MLSGDEFIELITVLTKSFVYSPLKARTGLCGRMHEGLVLAEEAPRVLINRGGRRYAEQLRRAH